MRYISEDGKVFEAEWECLEHENKLKAKEAEKAKAEQEKQRRYQEIVDKQNEIVNEEKKLAAMQKSYLEEFCDVKVGELGDMLDMFGITDFVFPFTLFRK